MCINLGRLQVKDAGVEDRVRVPDRLEVPVGQRGHQSHPLRSPSHCECREKGLPGSRECWCWPARLASPLVEALLGLEIFTMQLKANTVEQEEQPA